MREILGKAKTVRELLKGVKYSIDYYQREYKWHEKQIRELVDDLSDKFLEEYQPAHPRSKVADYPHYFLGSIIISKKESVGYIVDGQQRLTSLTLLLILLRNLQKDRAEKVNVDELIFSEKFGQKSFNLHVDERTPAMDALYEGQPFDVTDRPESVQNLVQRYHDLETCFPEELRERGAALLHRLAARERPPRRDHRLLGRRRLHDLRDDERPRALAQPDGHAQGLPAREHRRGQTYRRQHPLA